MFMVSIGISVTIQKSHIFYIIVINNYGTDTFLLALQMKIAKKYIFQMSGVCLRFWQKDFFSPLLLLAECWCLEHD